MPVERDEPTATGELCEKCGKPMVYKQGRYGRFMACSGYPECRHIKAESTGVNCPEEDCDGELVKKISKRGKPVEQVIGEYYNRSPGRRGGVGTSLGMARKGIVLPPEARIILPPGERQPGDLGRRELPLRSR